MIYGIGYGGYSGYSGYYPNKAASVNMQGTGQTVPVDNVSKAPAITPRPVSPVNRGSEISPYSVTNEDEAREAGLSEGQIRGLKKAGQIECATCAGRMYQDGSDENVSFKSAAHLSPTAAGAAVRSHEGEHVSNAYKKAAMNNGKVLHTGVSIHMAICPECGRSYVSGGTTSTSILYYGKSNSPYSPSGIDEAAGIKGRSVDVGA